MSLSDAQLTAVNLFESLRHRVDDPDTTFVFPSELTARFWCKRALHFSSAKSISSLRFLSWDQFKENCFHYDAAFRPVNRAVRLLFLYRLLERNRRNPRLSRIVPPFYAGQPHIFLESLQRLLPVLHRVAAIRSRWPRFSRDKLEDLENLHESYRDFLRKARLYEPNYEHPRFSPEGKKHIIFFPELIEDYGEFSAALSNGVELIPAPADIRPGTALRMFRTLPEEIRAAIRRCAALLDQGVDPQEIVLTVGQLEELEPVLRREAELYAVPLQFHLGKPLSEFPQITMLRKAYGAVESSCNLSAMKALLLCRSIPWKQESLCRALIRLALDGRNPGNTPSKDNWELSIESSRRNGNPRNLPLSRISAFYAALKHQLTQLGAAETFGRLKSCLVSFAADFLDLQRLKEEELKIFQFAMDTLEELERADELVAGESAETQASDTGAGGHAAFLTWWLYLGQRRYVPSRSGAGIPVYPFRVSGGMEPDHHIVINASQAATSHRVRRYPFLKLHEEQNLSDVHRELASVHLQLYSYSGREIRFSYARRDFHRSNLPPPLFLSRGIPLAEAATEDPEDAYERERKAWTDGSTFPLQEMQKSGYETAAIGAMGFKETDAGRQKLKDRRLIRALAERLHDREGRTRISATALERFGLCPFQFLWERLLRLGVEEYEPPTIDPIDFGVLLHRALDLFFSLVPTEEGEDSGALSVHRRDHYRRHLKSIVAEICSDYRRRYPTLLEPIAEEIQRSVEELVLDFLEVELELMGEERVEGTEVALQAAPAQLETILVGAIDRINRNSEGYTLVDYKKKNVPTRKDLFSPQAASVQMPFYIYLMELQDRLVTRAAYYSFENKRYHFVFGGPRTNMGNAEDVRRGVEAVKRRITDMRERISRGDYRIGASPPAGCSRCRLQEICRGSFSVNG
jgi:RecB family exonuclease